MFFKLFGFGANIHLGDALSPVISRSRRENAAVTDKARAFVKYGAGLKWGEIQKNRSPIKGREADLVKKDNTLGRREEESGKKRKNANQFGAYRETKGETEKGKKDRLLAGLVPNPSSLYTVPANSILSFRQDEDVCSCSCTVILITPSNVAGIQKMAPNQACACYQLQRPVKRKNDLAPAQAIPRQRIAPFATGY